MRLLSTFLDLCPRRYHPVLYYQTRVYLSFRLTQLYRYCILVFIQYYYMFRLSISFIIRQEHWFTKTVKCWRGLSLQTMGISYCKLYDYFSENGIISDIKVYDFYSVFGVIIIHFTITLHPLFVRTGLSHFLLFLWTSAPV
jgi:hypothetical protein